MDPNQGHEAISAKALIALLKTADEATSAARAEQDVYTKKAKAVCDQFKTDPKALQIIRALNKLKADRRVIVLNNVAYMTEILEEAGHWQARTGELFKEEEKERMAGAVSETFAGDDHGEVDEETMRSGIQEDASNAGPAEPEKPAKGKGGRKAKAEAAAPAPAPDKPKRGRPPKKVEAAAPAEPEPVTRTDPAPAEPTSTGAPVLSLAERRKAMREAKAAGTQPPGDVGLPDDANAAGTYRH